MDQIRSRELARKAAEKSIVLLKNESRLLPLVRENLKSVAVIGPSANSVISDWYGEHLLTR